MHIEEDFKELLRLLNKYKVRYCIIGSFALGFHARPRYTKDLDILIEPSLKNAQKLIETLREFGFGSLNLKPEDFCQEGYFIQLGYEPVRIDLVTSIQGLDFQQVWKKKAKGVYGAQRVYFIGLNDFIKSKQIANRSQDLADLEVLKKFQKKSSK